MRIKVPGINRAATSFHFVFEQQTVKAYAGETIAAALTSAGIYGFRETRGGKSRGVFCGMGVCGDCQIMVDGESRRACMEDAREGAVVRRHPAFASTRPAEPKTDTGELVPDLLVIGAGPAGLSAALTAASAGLDVLVVDERKTAGGQYFKQPAAGFAVDEAAVDQQFADGRSLIRSCHEQGVRLIPGATAWGAFGDDRIAILTPESNFIVRARRIVLATGAYERALPVPGWTLPGVITTGAAQTLLRAYQTAPGNRVLIAGNGPLNLQVADELCRAGVEVVAVAELAVAPWQGSVVPALAMGFYAPAVSITGLQHLLRLRRRRVLVHYRHVLTSVEGHTKAERATLSAIDSTGRPCPDSAVSFEVDAVCVNYGFLPQSELARALGCAFDFDHASGQLRARRGIDGRTSIHHVFIAGDAGGLGGAKVAMDQGELAGHAVVQDLVPGRSRSRQIWRVRRRLRRHAGFQKALWRVFDAPYLSHQLTLDDTLICRCEEIDRRSLTSLLRKPYPTLAASKKATRAGMGRCQGRYCTTLIAALSEAHGSAPSTSEDFFAPRPPARPVPLARLAQPVGMELQPVDLNSTTDRDANKSS